MKSGGALVVETIVIDRQQAAPSSFPRHQATTSIRRLSTCRSSSQQRMGHQQGHNDVYVEEIRKLKNKFSGLEIHHVDRKNNMGADVLSKLGSTRAAVPPRVFVH